MEIKREGNDNMISVVDGARRQRRLSSTAYIDRITIGKKRIRRHRQRCTDNDDAGTVLYRPPKVPDLRAPQSSVLSRLGLGPSSRVVRRVRLIKLIKGEIEQNRAFDHCGQRAIQRWRDRDQDGCVVEVCAVRCPCIRIAGEIHPLRLGFLCRRDT